MGERTNAVGWSAVWAVCAVVFLGIAGTAWFQGYKFFGGKVEEVRRSIYEESRAHVVGTNQHLGRLKLEYDLADNDNHRTALRAAILMEASEFSREHMTPEIRAFVDSLSTERTIR